MNVTIKIEDLDTLVAALNNLAAAMTSGATVKTPLAVVSGETEAAQEPAPSKAEKAPEAKKAVKKPVKKTAEAETDEKPELKVVADNVSMDDVRKAAMSAIKGGKRDEAMAVLGEFDAAKISDLAEEHFGTVLEQLKALI